MSRTIKRKQLASYSFYGNIHQYLEHEKDQALYWAHVKCSWESDYTNFEKVYANEYEHRTNPRRLIRFHRSMRGFSPGRYFRKQTVSKGRVHMRKELHKVMRVEGYEPYCRHDEKHAGYWD